MNCFRQLFQRMFPPSKAEIREKYAELDRRIDVLQSCILAAIEENRTFMNETLETQRKRQETFIHSELEAQRHWTESALLAQDESRDKALEGQRQWQEAFIRGELEAQRYWIESALLARDESRDKALEGQRQWQEAFIRGEQNAHQRWEDAAFRESREILSSCEQKMNLAMGILQAAVADVIRQYIYEIKQLFPLASVAEPQTRFCRIGRRNDGGYIMIDDFPKHGIAYSVGIAEDVSWDREMAERGFDVYMYDHTIPALPEEHRGFHFRRIGLCGQYDPSNPKLETLDMLLAENGHQDVDGMILKIDIEGWEWDVLNAVEPQTLSHFSQIVIEFHDLLCIGKLSSFQSALQKLNKSHQLVHLHANNYGEFLEQNGYTLPELMEATYLNRKYYKFVEWSGRLPTELDERNNPMKKEIPLFDWCEVPTMK